MLKLHKISAAFAAASFGTALMNSVFTFAYVKVFLNRYHVSESSFHTAQAIYMIWNAVNDPLFAYWQDTSSKKWCRSRRHSILYGAPLWAIAFLTPWFQWGEDGSWLVGVHMLVALSFYDALLTFVLLAKFALFAELSTNQEDRIQLVRYMQVGSLVGSCSVFAVVRISDNLTDYTAFQVCAVVIALMAYLSLRYSGNNLKRDDATNLSSLNSANSVHRNGIGQSGGAKSRASQYDGFFKITRQILHNRNFLCLAFANFCQTLEKALCSGFTPIIGDALVEKDLISPQLRAVWYGASFVAPQVCTLLASSQVKRYGYFRVIQASYVFKIVTASLMYLIGYDQPWKLYVMIVFMISDTVVTFATFSFFSMSLSDIIKEDMELNNRNRPISAMVFATNALVVKPAESVSPMVGVAILNAYGYEAYKAKTLRDGAELVTLHDAMFALVCVIPAILGCLQLFVWSLYRIRHNRVKELTTIRVNSGSKA